MKFTISPDKSRLTITADDQERAALNEVAAEDPSRFQSDAAMREFFEPLVCNSELSWLNASDTGDLTDAPMLGILADVRDAAHVPFPCLSAGHWDGRDWAQKIAARWAFMAYDGRSPLDDLRTRGEVIFTGGEF